MNIRKILSTAAVAIALTAPAALPTLARADVMIGQNGMCLDVNGSTNAVAAWSCHAGANQNFFGGYGQQRYNGLCLDGVKGQQLRMNACDAGKQSQKWGIQANGQLKNEQGFCADYEGGNASQGTRALLWDCNGGLPNNQRFLQGSKTSGPSLAGRALGAFNGSRAPISNGSLIGAGSTLVGNDGASFSVRAGQLVAAGGGNLVAAGGGNLVAAGGGNILSPGNITGGSLISPGNMTGGSLISPGNRN